MKALVLHKYGDADKAFKLEEVAAPEINNDEVLIDVHSSGLNFADVVARRGKYPDAPKNPAILGYDVAGKVTQIGSNVSHVSVGDRVTALTRFGGYASVAKTMKEGVVKIPDEMTFAEATALSTQYCTAYYCAHECIQLNEGDKVLIHAAAGGVGTALVQMAKNAGCYIFGTASSSKIEYLRQMGVDQPIDYTTENFSSIISKDKQTVDFIFDSIGGKTFKDGMKILSKGGKMVTFGAAAQMGEGLAFIKSLQLLFGFGFYSPIQLLMKSQGIIGVNMLRIADNKPLVLQRILNNVTKLYTDGIIKPKIGATFPISEYVNAHNFLENRKSIGKVVMEWS